VGRVLEGHEGRVQSLVFTPDGRTLASAGADGAVLLRDVATQKTIGSAQAVEPNAFLSAVFTPDGARLFAVSEQRRAIRWEVSSEAWKRHACRVAGRELTAREWQDALPGRPYRSICRGG
jgi:WD40 repeat protein